jgi:UDP-N-acetylmuramate: L-alanyl-gamma-D-glutamyl-meso-diaminopimelate ligase
MGALAGLLKAAGHEVRGSDQALYPPMSDQLRQLQIPVFEGFSADNLGWGPNRVVVGNVCSKDHVEVVEAQRLELTLTSLPATLAEALIDDKHSVVVTGTHGKTTTTSVLADIFVTAGRDPSFFVGGVPISHGRGWRLGNGEDFLVEGDEYDSAFFDKESKFLHYKPRTAILTSVELDHVDIFSSMDAVRTMFAKFIRLIPEDGLLVVAADSKEAMALVNAEARCTVETYSVHNGEAEEGEAAPTWQARNVEHTKSGRCQFEVWRGGELFDSYETLLNGEHNMGNVLAAVAVAHSRGIASADIRRGIARFAGVKRRQELRGVAQGVYVIDDYAHHPTAVRETLKALRRRFPGRRLLAIFEPRSATSRRKTFQREFADAFRHADALIVGKPHDMSKIPESERFDPERLALDVHRVGVTSSYQSEVDGIVAYAVEMARPGDVIVVMSSGAFGGLHERLIAGLGDAVMVAKRDEMQEVRDILSSAGLADAAEDDMAPSFLVLRNENGLAGCVALEVFGDDAVLRSLAVKPDARGVGYGWILADTAISMARHRGVRRIYLLTETASDFFAAKHGFRVVDSSTISEGVLASQSFHDRPASAIAMRLDL